MDGLYLQLSKWMNEFSLCEQFSSYKNKCRDFLKRWPVASKIMDGPVKMNTEWSVWPVHVLGCQANIFQPAFPYARLFLFH